jgi:hypothetical protein
MIDLKSQQLQNLAKSAITELDDRSAPKAGTNQPSPPNISSAKFLAELFSSNTFEFNGHQVEADFVFSDVGFLPAILTKAQALHHYLFDPSDIPSGASMLDVLGVKREPFIQSMLGVKASMLPLDAGSDGLMRCILLAQAAAVTLGIDLTDPRMRNKQIPLNAVYEYYMSEGAEALAGHVYDQIAEISPSA